MRMTYGLSTLALATLMSAAPAVAQSGSMAKPMPMGKEKVYTGCLAAGSMAGHFMLEHAEEDMAMGAGARGKDAMGKGSMAKESMGKETMGKDMAHSMAVSSTAVDLSKHVGHQVSVTVSTSGMTKPDAMGKPDTVAKPDAMAKPAAMAPAAMMTVSSLKMIAVPEELTQFRLAGQRVLVPLHRLDHPDLSVS